jgi:glycosyltransferase involved in cell wall biosynthesis
MPRASVIVSSYNQPHALELVLESLLRQSDADIELVIGDDGSQQDTRALVERFAARAPFPVSFVTQADLGFRKAMAVNNAIRRARGELLLFLDGDCIAPRHWVERHVAALRAGVGLTVGGYVRLDLERSRALSPARIADGSFEHLASPADRRALLAIHAGQLLHLALGKSDRPKILGGNFAATRDAIWAVDGFDETYEGFSKEDSDIRNRLKAAGTRARSLWHSNWVLHCDHGLDPGRKLPGGKRRPPDRAYYLSRKGAVRAARGLSGRAVEPGAQDAGSS